ncbi:hypothetical protein [Labrys wisconsinensis]|uniref:Uncharacterized protein n=1 Tax=Labrys wisconsinensis TaxID=425677 RepID=A0ABU0J640_9HYPH|nr:hypothetical protein [Labrys wisconsinensis]MDQ0469715.1 hypothetical protein [Labrys wisconsinensis]
MGAIVQFPQSTPRQTRLIDAGPERSGAILFFTGVRIERHADTAAIEADATGTRPAQSGTPSGRRRRKA